jgi:hypothetical protein
LLRTLKSLLLFVSPFLDSRLSVHPTATPTVTLSQLLCLYLTNCVVLPYILESNAHPVFGDFLNEKKLVRDSIPHLSFNHPLPTGRLIE